MRGTLLAAVAVVAVLAVSGCASTGGDALSNSIYDTHRIAKNLESDLGPRVTQLNETAADLSARVEASDVTVRRLQTLAEENQVKLDQLNRQLSDLTRVLYGHLGLTVSTPGSGYQSGAAIVEPPAGTDPLPGTAQTAVTPVPGGGVDVPAPGPASGTALSDYHDAQKSYVNEDYATALAKYDSYLASYPTAEYADNAQYWKAECLRKLDRYDEAIAEYDKVLKNHPTSEKVTFALYSQADVLLRQGQTARATELLEQLVRDYPMSPAALKAKPKLDELKGTN